MFSKRRIVPSWARAGDYIFVEFGHNDQKQQGEGKDPWLSLYENLRNFIAEARKQDMWPVLVTPMHRRRFDEHGQVINTYGEYSGAVRKLAARMISLFHSDAEYTLIWRQLKVRQFHRTCMHKRMTAREASFL